MGSSLGARCAALVLAALLIAAAAGAAGAQTTTFLAGIVSAAGGPAAGAAVTVTGSNLTLRAMTGADGRFVFPAIPIGSYDVDVLGGGGTAALKVEVASAGATVAIELTPLREIGRTSLASRPPAAGSGTDLSLGADLLGKSPAGGSLPALLLQLPGAARGANGVVHINGDHGDINYIVDGVAVPQELNRTLGTEIDPNDVGFIEALQGAYPAQYGERFAAVLNVNTRNGSGPPGLAVQLAGGSYAHLDSDLAYHAPLGSGSFVAALRSEAGSRGLDPPNLDSPHNRFSNVNQFLRITQPLGNDFLNLSLSHASHTYQIPSDVAGGAPAATDDVETQDDLFASLQYRHPIGDRGALSFGPSFKRSRIRDLGDTANDFVFGAARNPGAATDCARALTSAGPVVSGVVTNPIANPAVAYGNGSCAVSLFGDRTAIDLAFNLDYENRSPAHDVKFGGVHDATNVSKRYSAALQPGNFLAPIFTPATPGAAYTVTDNAPTTGHLTALYLQDSWKLGAGYQLDYGVRADAFSVASTQFAAGFAQFSPRLKLSRSFGPRTSVYAYYGRFFTPFSLENVSPLAAYTLNLPLQTSVAQFDLKPQRDSVYEAGAHVGLRRGDLGVRIMQKNATDLIDDTQIGTTNLHQDINDAQGRIATQTVYFQEPLARAGRFYASITHTYAVNRGCETQLLAPCFGASIDWAPADHDQRIDASAGVIATGRNGNWWGVDGEYGSGLSSAQNPAGGITCAGLNQAQNLGGPCKTPPHLTFDAERGIVLGGGVALTIRVQNLLNDRYLVTYLNAQGNHYAPPRTVDAGLRFSVR